jgi:hypothetical protein
MKKSLLSCSKRYLLGTEIGKPNLHTPQNILICPDNFVPALQPVVKAPVTYAVTTILTLAGETKATFTPQKQETFLTVLAAQLKVLRSQVAITDMQDVTMRRRNLKATTGLQITLAVTGKILQIVCCALHSDACDDIYCSMSFDN